MSHADKDFENEVRRIARAKWPAAQYSGAKILDGRERDGVFETEDSINFIEATVSLGTGKAKEDTRKIFKLIVEHNKLSTMKVAVGWFVTKNEPTAEQRKEVQESGRGQVKAVSFSQFQQSLIDVRGYLAARKNHTFGSVQDFSSTAKDPTVPFIEIGLLTGDQTLFIEEIETQLLEGKRFAVVGQYGAGKSMTLRELFLRLEKKYIRGTTAKFPVYINLREHSGQRDPIEILERHARSIGFDSPSSLIRAWRAGFVILLADGFDEIASLGVQGTWKKLKDLRTRSLEGVRQLIRESQVSGVVVSGRSHYFENDRELSTALGLSDATVLAVDEFNETQMRSFLAAFYQQEEPVSFPAWLPTRPLLLGYLASRNFLSDLSSGENPPDVVDGWDYLLGRIYEREEKIETNLDGATLRRILERLATLARTSEDGLGPITRSSLFSAFTEVCGYEPDEQGILAIQRLPGLGIYRAEDESRCFVDGELAAVCNGRELLRFFESPYTVAAEQIWVDAMNNCDRPIQEIGVELAHRKLKEQGDVRKSVRQAVAFLNSRTDLSCVRGDVASFVIENDISLDIHLHVKEINFSEHQLEFHAENSNLSNLSFSHCLFDQVAISPEITSQNLPTFDSCMFQQIVGRVSVSDLPPNKFSSNCDFVSFDATGTSGAIRNTQMNTAQKVLLITLRKLFVQSFSGRAESALYRGLDVDERRYVPDILKLLKRYELVTDYSKGDGVIWLPARKALDRVKKILIAPAECNEQVVKDALSIS
ncbi:NACHT domain protein [Bordetella bronchiseptica MBORD624]|uniref:NACHT domain-containing protein n=1 Tax=Bordetella bronchiseptica TaxID=518 RepID=UPI000460F72A|nr:NACHT domain-containing protein [Bordetella bronchiseptica]KDC63302.1 NACHT domain protein [Bordetella bronchiseptica MBORD595]KDC64526.1 NACHT domain protein [Bordetella bronchiseptica MBORD624]VEF45520.1 NACHT domain [Bordetella bronchiseptica]